MKNARKVIAMVLVLALTVAMSVAGTIAYLKDDDAETNVFTVGNVEIDLIENYEQGSKLLPATGSAQDKTLKNGVKKEVSVKNTGTEDAFVRVHIAIPNVLDNGNPDFDAGKNVLHFNFPKENAAAGKWDWTTTTGEPYSGTPWNYYEVEITDPTTDSSSNSEAAKAVKYNVYVVTYETALKAGEETPEKAIDQVYLDGRVTNEDIARINEALNNQWQIKVVAEGAQAAGFNDAYEALNEAFGKPGSYNPFA